MTQPTPWTIAEERRLRELIALKLYRQQNEKIRYFKPNQAQQAFIGEISRPGAFVVINAGGNGSGKSYGLIAILAGIMWPSIAAPCFSAPIFKSWPYPKRIRIASTPAELGNISSLQVAIDELWPKGKYEGTKNGKSYLSQFKTNTGFTVDLMSYEQDRSEFAGPSVGCICFNEPPPEPIYKECLARLRRGGIAIGALTSLNDEPWVVDSLLTKANGNDIRVIYGDVEMNCRDHSPNGTLSHDQVEKILGQYDPDEREARKTGKPLSLSGRIYKGFNRDIHVAKEPLIVPNQGVTHYQVVDPAIAKPLAVIYAYADATGLVTVYDEWPNMDFEGARDSNLSVRDYAEIFQAKEEGRKISNRIIDRHFSNVRRTLGGLSLREEFANVGLDYSDSYTVGDASSEVESGILKVKDFLRYDATKGIDSLNRPRLLISPNCRNTIASFEKWGRNPDTGKPKEEYKDFADVVRYLVMANPEHEIDRVWADPKLPYFGVKA